VHAELIAPTGTALRDLLFAQGVEFPCGGQGRCRGCRVHVLEGQASVNDAQRERLSAKELAQGWRLACQCALDDDLVREVRKIAVERDTTLTGLVRAHLQELAAEHAKSGRKRRELEALRESFEKYQFNMGKRTWKREDLHERR
jgi:ferredoxin